MKERHPTSIFYCTLVLSIIMMTPLSFSAESFDAAQAVGEDGITLSGKLYRTFGDPPEGEPAISYRLVDAKGKSWELNVPDSIKKTMNNLRALYGLGVTVTGAQTGERGIDVYLMDYDAGEKVPPQAAPISGSKSFRTLLCRFNGDASEPENLAFFDGMMGTTKPGADHYWQELSYGNIDLTGSSQHDWLELPEPRSSYVDDSDPDNQGADLTALFNDCKQVHEDNGVDFTGVFGINLIFNDSLDCCAWGGGRDGFAVTWMPPWSWGSTSHGVLAQEMGHSFGLPHEGCQGTESPYDSNWDPMSSAGDSQIHINAAFKDDLGWITGARKYIADDSLNQVVDLERLALPELDFHPESYLMAEIPIPGESQYYVVEARQFAGYDEDPDNPPFEAVVIHYVDWAADDKNAVVVHEDDGNDNCNDESGAWVPGELFVDDENGISIAVVAELETGFTIAINPATDLAVRKTASPDPVTAGELITYTVRVDNLGPGLATNVIVTDVLPDGVDYLADTDTCVEAPAGTLTCTAPAPILPYHYWTFSILARVDSAIVDGLEGSITNVVSVVADQDEGGTNNEYSHTSFVVSEADVAVQKICKPDEPALAGTVAFCEIFVTNYGPSMASNVQLVDEISSDGSYNIVGIFDDDAGTSCVQSGGDVECDMGDVDAGEVIKVTVNVETDEGIDINDLAAVSSDTPDPDTSNNSATGSVTFLAWSDLSIVKSDSPDPVVAGEILTYTLNVAANGPSTAVNVIVEDQVPAGVEMISAAVTMGGGSCVVGVPGNPAQPTLCTLGDAVSGATATITIVVRVLPDTTGILHNDARIYSDTLDVNNENNQATEDTTVVSATDIEVTKSDDQDPVAAGDELKYTVTVTNHGPSTATMVDLVDTLPAETSLVSSEVLEGEGVCGQTGSDPDVLRCTLGDLDPGEMFSVVITVLVDASVPDGTTITNLAEVFENGVLETSVTEDTGVIAVADLWIDKTGLFLTDNPSKTILYTLTVYNAPGCSGDDPQVCGSGGPSDAQDVVVVDTLPSTAKKLRVSFVSEECVYTESTHSVTCTMSTPLAAGDSVFFEIEVRPKGSLGAITNTASVSSSTTDPDSGNNSDDMLIIVGGGGQK